MVAFVPMDAVKNGKITVKRRQTVFENARFHVFADHIADARGNEVRDFLVVAPRNQTRMGLTGIMVVPVRQGEIFLFRAYRHPIAGHILEAPRGFIDPGEEPYEAALRELNEETGLLCQAENLISLGLFYPSPGVLTARIALFAATNCEADGQRLEDEIGVDEGIWIPLNEVRRMLSDHEVEEAATCVALHRYLESLST